MMSKFLDHIMFNSILSYENCDIKQLHKIPQTQILYIFYIKLTKNIKRFLFGAKLITHNPVRINCKKKDEKIRENYGKN